MPVFWGRGERTGIPEAWILASCVEEKTKWPPSLAAVKRLATSEDRFSERPSCIINMWVVNCLSMLVKVLN